MRKGLVLAALLAWGLIAPAGATAAVQPNPLFGNGMVLQQGKPVPVWGTADDGEKVTVRFLDQEVSTVAKGGKWMVRLKELKAGGPFALTIQGSNTVKLDNVLVGEVWVCSGQSNMEMAVASTAGAQEAIASSKNPMIRLFTVARATSDKPLAAVKGQWKECGPDTVKGFSAVGYYFGRDLQKALGVPVGLIHTSWGGTPAEAWTSRAALEANPALRVYVERYDALIKNLPAAREKYQAALAKYKEEADLAKQAGKRPPRPPQDPNSAVWPTRLYNAMIAPLIPYAIQGAIWYQGESNAGQAYLYRTLFPAMIQNWRADWKQGDFPFLFVQLAPFMKKVSEPGESNWAELREAQLLTTKVSPRTGMAVITDVGEENDIHPRHKAPVGARLALAARAIAYGQKVEYSGPDYKSMRIEGDKAVLTFDHVGGGLDVKGGDAPTGFAVAGADHKFVNAEAKIEGDHVVVWSPKVAKPVAVRYGWANFPLGNLWNKAGLPASPFRTDDFPGVTQPKPRK